MLPFAADDYSSRNLEGRVKQASKQEA